MIIGLEGPAGSGKTTMARTVGLEIGATVMEGGIWYRALTYLVIARKISLTDIEAMSKIAASFELEAVNDDLRGERILVNMEDITEQIYSGKVSGVVAIVAHEIIIRDIIEPRLINWVNHHENVIIVGRHLKRAFPESRVMRLLIEPDEAEKRHMARATKVTNLVKGRNDLDGATAKLLGVVNDGVVEVDVSRMTVDEQAEVFRAFVLDDKS